MFLTSQSQDSEFANAPESMLLIQQLDKVYIEPSHPIRLHPFRVDGYIPQVIELGSDHFWLIRI